MKKLKFTTFAVKMLVINRYFKIDAARRDLHYEPLITFREGWNQTKVWFQENWLPNSEFAPGKQKKRSSTVGTMGLFLAGFLLPVLIHLIFGKSR